MLTAGRFTAITERYPRLRIGVVGDYCLDRYLEIDPARRATSIETGLPVHNVINVRAQPGAAGTILNNLVALGIGTLVPVGFSGDDGEGYELRRALAAMPGVGLQRFITAPERRTFTYCKPLLLEPGQQPRELSRLDSKNWTPTPLDLQQTLAAHVRELAGVVDALILMDQVDTAETGVVTSMVCAAAHEALAAHPKLLVLADSRRGVANYPPLGFKMNGAEFVALTGAAPALVIEDVQKQAAALARQTRQPVFVTLAERGIVGAAAEDAAHVPALPVRGPIDIVGAGDAVTANLTAALAAGASPREAMEMAMAAASIVIHQLGTTGVAQLPQLAKLLDC